MFDRICYDLNIQKWEVKIEYYDEFSNRYKIIPTSKIMETRPPRPSGGSTVLEQGGGFKARVLTVLRGGYMRNPRLWMIAMHLALADKTAADWWKCDTLAKDQAQSVLCPMSGIVCISCRRASIYVDSWVFVLFVSTGFGCSTRISEVLFVVVVTHFAA